MWVIFYLFILVIVIAYCPENMLLNILSIFDEDDSPQENHSNFDWASGEYHPTKLNGGIYEDDS